MANLLFYPDCRCLVRFGERSDLVMPENIASVRVLEKTGLRYAETVTFWGTKFLKYVMTR